MLFRKICGIDLGTDTIKICDKNEKKYVHEKNMIAVRDKAHVIAIGLKAFEMYEKAPVSVEAGSPMKNGAIADVQNMGIVLNRLLRRYTNPVTKYPDILMTVPVGISELERMAFQQLLTGGIRSKRVALIENGLADAAGIGMPVLHPMGNVVVNIGASTTDISVISEGKVIVGKRLGIGGSRLDEDIRNIVRRRCDLNIGHRTSEILKNNLAYLLHGVPKQMKVYGIHTVTGLPVPVIVTSADINDAIADSLKEIVDAVKITLERTPPQLAADIQRNGVYLTGGVSQIPNFAEYAGRYLEITTYQVPQPTASTVRGLVRIMNDPQLGKLAFPLREL
ncbi:rod shape-determining protein [Lachnospiraceae bacterium 46-15]